MDIEGSAKGKSFLNRSTSLEVEGVFLDYLGHSGFIITCRNGKRIAIDPYNVSPGIEKVDYVLITHDHYDHCSVKDIQKLIKPGTVIVGVAGVQSKIARLEDVEIQIVEIGDELTFGRFKIEAVPAYNIGKKFHPKNEGWIGYVIKIEDVIIYHAGDTDNIPELSRLSGYGKVGNKFVVLLPVSGKFVMDAHDASEVAKMLKPTLAIPMHYGAGVAGTEEDANEFVELCGAKGIKAEVMERI